MKKENILHIAKAIILFALMLIWFTIKIYGASLSFTVEYDGTSTLIELEQHQYQYILQYFNYIFAVQPQTMIVGALFGALGILELLSIKK